MHFSLLLPVICFQVQLFDLLHQRVARVGGCALVLKGPVGEQVQIAQKLFFTNAVLLDAGRDIQFFGKAALTASTRPATLAASSFSAKAKVTGQLCVFFIRHKLLILWGIWQTLLASARCIQSDIRQQNGVRTAMRHMVLPAQLVRHGVVQSQERVGKRHAGNAGSIVHGFPCARVCRTPCV